jgi:hypothetical protein
MSKQNTPFAIGTLEEVGVCRQYLLYLPSQFQIESTPDGCSIFSIVHIMIAQQEHHLVGVCLLELDNLPQVVEHRLAWHLLVGVAIVAQKHESATRVPLHNLPPRRASMHIAYDNDILIGKHK